MPHLLARFVARLRGLVRRRAAASELDEELQFHVSNEIDANVARGMSAREARRVALRDLGGLVQTTEAARDVRTLWVEAVWRDARHALRALRHSPSFTLVAISVLTMSVGVCVAVLSVVDAVILRELPFDEPSRLVAVGEQEQNDPGSVPVINGDIALNAVSPDYFRALRIPLVKGRTFTDDDRRGAPSVVILNRRAAQMFFGGAAIGKSMNWRHGGGERTVVGIVGDIRYDGPENDPRPQAFVPFAQTSQSAATLILRTRPGGQGVLGDVRAAFAAAYPEGLTVPVSVDVQTLESYMSDLVAQRRFNMWLLGIFGLLGIVIACIGIYGVMAYLVAQRTHEIGIRMALGALPLTILWSVIGSTSRYIGLGLIAGFTGAWMLSTTVKGLLFGIQPHDATVYALVGGLLAGVGLLAAVVPARRAARVDPLVALRHDV